MTLPKKKTRKIVVDGVVYRYLVRQYNLTCCDGCFSHSNLTFESPDGKVQHIGTYEEAVTPAIVATLIRGKLADSEAMKFFEV